MLPFALIFSISSEKFRDYIFGSIWKVFPAR